MNMDLSCLSSTTGAHSHSAKGGDTKAESMHTRKQRMIPILNLINDNNRHFSKGQAASRNIPTGGLHIRAGPVHNRKQHVIPDNAVLSNLIT